MFAEGESKKTNCNPLVSVCCTFASVPSLQPLARKVGFLAQEVAICTFSSRGPRSVPNIDQGGNCPKSGAGLRFELLWPSHAWDDLLLSRGSV